MIVKILSWRAIPKGVFSSTFPVPKKIQNNSRNSKNSKTIGHPDSLFMELHASPLQLFFIPSKEGFLPVILEIPHSIKPNLKSSNPLPLGRGFTLRINFKISRGRVMGRVCTSWKNLKKLQNFLRKPRKC